MSSRRLWIIGAACAALAACNTVNSHIGDEDPFIGEAVKYNAAIQTINPAPVYSASAAQPGDNGDTGAQAVKRYRTDKVNDRHKQESTIRTGALSTTSGVGKARSVPSMPLSVSEYPSRGAVGDEVGALQRGCRPVGNMLHITQSVPLSRVSP